MYVLALILLFGCDPHKSTMHLFEVKEISLTASNIYNNPYKEVTCGVVLSGPGFKKKIHGFWNGRNDFVVRVAATVEGNWSWESFSNQDDPGLNNQSGEFEAIPWTEDEVKQNPNRRGFIRPTQNGHALEYADGSPFFMLGDTWWSAGTWRYPLKGIEPKDDYIPDEGISLEEALHFRKKQGYNTIAMIAAFPNWDADDFPPQFMDIDSIGIRQAWEKNSTNTAQDMHDDDGNRPFYPSSLSPVLANYDSINPEYFINLDKKIQYMTSHGFVIFLETVRRDHGPSWKHYFDWPESFSRYVQYIISRYGAYNIIFSGIHLDWITEDYSLSAREYNDALTYHYQKYGGLPYGQPHSILIDGSTYERFGHEKDVPWLTMHAVGNAPRNHLFYPMLETIFNLDPPFPAANLEPYYPGWDNPWHNRVAGERPKPNSDRDHYFGRAQMYGSVLSGGLAGHMYGSGAYDGNTTGEPKKEGDRPYIWEGLNYSSGKQLPYLADFLLSEGKAYQECKPNVDLIKPNKADDAPEKGLDGWSFLLLNDEKSLGFLCFENKAEIPVIKGLHSDKLYDFAWFDPIKGKWLENPMRFITDNQGKIKLSSFPNGNIKSKRDWALKIKLSE